MKKSEWDTGLVEFFVGLFGFVCCFFFSEPVKKPVKPERDVVAHEKLGVKGLAWGTPEIKGGLLVSKWFKNNSQATQFNVCRFFFLCRYVNTHFSFCL